MPTFRAGLVIPQHPDSSRTLAAFQEADHAGVRTAWQTSVAGRPDTLTTLAAAAATTSRIHLGTSIVPTYPRHPAIMASQALAIEGLAPGRLRLGIGPSHAGSMEGALGLTMGKPLSHLRDYVAVVRALLETGAVEHDGEHYRVHSAFAAGTTPPGTDIVISALRAKSFQLGGEIADGVMSWVTPISYLVETALPAVAEGATKGQRQAPPVIAHVPVAVTTDRERALAATARDFGGYANYPFYARMFEAAGFPPEGTQASATAIESLAVYGTPDEIRARLEGILAEGIGEIIVSPVPVDDGDAERRELLQILAG